MIIEIKAIKYFSVCQLLNEQILEMMKFPFSCEKLPLLLLPNLTVFKIHWKNQNSFHQQHKKKISKGKMLCLKGNKTSVIRNDFREAFYIKKRAWIWIIKRAGEYLGSYINVDIKFYDIFFGDNLRRLPSRLLILNVF